jgi:hypothetical protein
VLVVDELSRWQGTVESDLKGVKERVGDLEDDQRSTEKSLVALKVQLASLKTQVGIWSAVGGIIGAGVVSLAVLLLGGGHTP